MGAIPWVDEMSVSISPLEIVPVGWWQNASSVVNTTIYFILLFFFFLKNWYYFFFYQLGIMLSLVYIKIIIHENSCLIAWFLSVDDTVNLGDIGSTASRCDIISFSHWSQENNIGSHLLVYKYMIKCLQYSIRINVLSNLNCELLKRYVIYVLIWRIEVLRTIKPQHVNSLYQQIVTFPSRFPPCYKVIHLL